MPNWIPVDAKDPAASRWLRWDFRADVSNEGVPLTGATIIEVDCDDVAVTTPTVTIGTPVIDSEGLVTALVSGGTLDANVLLRCAYVLANGVTDHGTLLLPIRNR